MDATPSDPTDFGTLAVTSFSNIFQDFVLTYLKQEHQFLWNYLLLNLFFWVLNSLKITMIECFCETFLTTPLAIFVGTQKEGKHLALVFSFSTSKVDCSIDIAIAVNHLKCSTLSICMQKHDHRYHCSYFATHKNAMHILTMQ